ncbi:MAG: DEAD/DEAH box helicase family protein [Candidatus Lokiarchaeota archaeon]|nr:DEAD/DEAH box helicase family protein [Candidatus Lokiarchaeota archaeon]
MSLCNALEEKLTKKRSNSREACWCGGEKYFIVVLINSQWVVLMSKKNIKSQQISWENLRLWKHQKEAIRNALDYFKSGSEKAHLLLLPTGSGKTAITAVLSRLIPKIKNTLVVVPSESLRIQNRKEIELNFWNKVKVDCDTIHHKEIVELLPSNVNNMLARIGDNQFVGVLTAQALLSIYRNEESAYQKLKKCLSLVIFDEGHREPALEWSNSIRNLEKPTVLLSATPYRNDLKVFNLDTEKFYQFSYAQAIKTNVVRKIEIVEIENLCSASKNFVKMVVTFFESKKSELVKNGIYNPKVIIRCETKEIIREIVEILKREGKRVIGIHEEFKNTQDLVKKVPLGMEYEYWVHQFKLTEGIDDPSFSVLAIYNHFSNSRSLIQQIGRITRNPNFKPKLCGYVLTDLKQKIKIEWNAFTDFDEYLYKEKRLLEIDKIIEQYISLHPQLYYFLNRYRKQINFYKQDLYKSFRYKLTTNAYKNNSSYSFETLKRHVLKELIEVDYDIKKTEQPVDNKTKFNTTLIITYLNYSNSNLLLSDLFIEVELGFTFIKVIEDNLYYYDTTGRISKFISENYQRINISQLDNLLSKADRFGQVTLLNTDLGRHSIRSKTLAAFSLNEIAPSLNDHQQVYSTISASIKAGSIGNKRRYVGFTRGRITDSSIYTLEYEDYCTWLKSITNELNKKLINNVEFLNRFANSIDNPDTIEPSNILIDIEDVKDEFRDSSSENSPMLYDELCMSISDKNFEWVVNGNNFRVEISYDQMKKRYDLICSKLEKFIRYTNDQKTTENLISYINRTQSFRLILDGSNLIYAFAHFYKPKFDIIGRKASDRLPILSIFKSFPQINKISSEKGNASLLTNGKTWHKDTLFGLIARQGKRYSNKKLEDEFNFEYLICNDLGKEESDFIGANEKSDRLVFIHCKALKQTRKVSASVFQEVCGQLIKNLDYLSPYSEREINSSKWNNIWSISKIGKAERIVRGNLTPARLRSKINSLIENPNTTKEVWIVLGNGFNLTEFENKLYPGKEPELIQIVYLLTSTWEAASQLGAKLKVFC